MWSWAEAAVVNRSQLGIQDGDGGGELVALLLVSLHHHLCDEVASFFPCSNEENFAANVQNLTVVSSTKILSSLGDAIFHVRVLYQGFDVWTGCGVVFNLTKGDHFFAPLVVARAHDKPVFALTFVLLVCLERDHLLAALQVTLVLDVLDQHLPQQAPTLSHRLPASGTISPLEG